MIRRLSISAVFSLLLAQGTFAQLVPEFEWATTVSSNLWDQSYSVDIDSEGNVYTMGYFSDTVDFDPGPDEYLLHTESYLAPPYHTDFFIQKLNTDGEFVWARSFGGSRADGSAQPVLPPFPTAPGYAGGNIVVDEDDNLFLCGIFFSDTIDLDPGSGVFNAYNNSPSNNFNSDYLVSKLDANGDLIWGRTFGGRRGEQASACQVDGDGNVIVVGSFIDTVDFDPYPNSSAILMTTEAESIIGHEDVFIQKLDGNGDLIWVKQLVGNSTEFAHDVDIDSQGNIYVCGTFRDTVDFDPGPSTYELVADVGDPTNKANFLVKLDVNGGFVYARQYRSAWSVPRLTIDEDDNLIFSGTFSDSVNVNPSGAENYLFGPHNHSSFLIKISSLGQLLWTGQFNGFIDDLITDSTHSIFGCGYFSNPFGDADLNPGPGVLLLDTSNAIVFKLDSAGHLNWYSQVTTTGYGTCSVLSIGNLGEVVFSGSFKDTVNVAPSSNTPYFVGSQPEPNRPDGLTVKWTQRDTTVGINESTDTASLTVYPNPARATVQVVFSKQITNSRLAVMDILGQMVYGSTFSGRTHIDISDWANGLYLVQVTNGSNRTSTKLIKY